MLFKLILSDIPPIPFDLDRDILRLISLLGLSMFLNLRKREEKKRERGERKFFFPCAFIGVLESFVLANKIYKSCVLDDPSDSDIARVEPGYNSE